MRRYVCLLALVLLATSLHAGQGFWIEDGDEVLFWGDSITDDGIYPRMIENYVLTRYPQWRVTFYNLGWGGDRASFFPRMERDIQLCRPSKATIMLGMNDGLYQPFDREALGAYLHGMRQLLEILRLHSDPDVFVISPTPFDLRCRTDIALGKDTSTSKPKKVFYPSTLRRFTGALQKLADAEACRYLDLNEKMTELIEDLDGFDGNYQVTAEGVHPNVDGQFFMALEILDAMGAPRDVATVVIDAGKGVVDSVDGCQVRQLKATPRSLSFERADQSLPLPVYPSVRSTVLRATQFFDDWNRDWLVVTGLDSGWYALRIDGTLVDVLPAAELAAGVNLSRYPFTPMMIQAYRVFEATERRQDAFYAKWRRVLLPDVRSPSDYTPFLADAKTGRLDAEEERAFRDQHKFNQPGVHRFELVRVGKPDFSELRRSLPCAEFLDRRVRIHLEVDARTLHWFEPPLCLHGNFSYAPQYQWAILETHRYYTDVPVRMYDDGTHGDRKAGDGCYSVDLYVRQNSGHLQFEVQDGRYLREYWIRINPASHRNTELDRLTTAWGRISGLGNEAGNRLLLPTDADVTLRWDRSIFKRALEDGLL